ncbi:MAG: helix-turn-helix transcriptional regulator [Gammaproteobacteria bacterium]|nr:helix-turn-helix transcriptional regulator [Gammaproteobacteria bacterium]
MNKSKRKRLERNGWKVGNTEEFLALSPEESRFIELKLALGHWLCEQREARKLTQTALARKLRSSQSRVAKMETGDSSVSLDLLVRSLFSLGVTKRELARFIASSTRSQTAEGYINPPGEVATPRSGNRDRRAE